MNPLPQPVVTGCSANRNVHLVSRDRRGNLHLAPGHFGRNAGLICLGFLPFFLYLCHRFNAERDVWVVAVLFPLVAGGSFVIGHLGYRIWGTRVVFDHWRQQIHISGIRHRKNLYFHFSDVCAIQRLCSGRQSSSDGDWDSYQVNLVFRDQSRYNLLDSAGLRQLDRIGEALAEYLKVPFERYDKSEDL